MLSEYETGFTILETPELAGTALLTSVADRLEAMFSDDRSDGSPQIIEREISSSAGYAVVGSDCLHSLDPEHAVRIQARLCTESNQVTAQIRVRFLSSNDDDPADLTAGPPAVLKELVDNYDCKIGTYEFRNEVFQVENDYTAQRVMSFITNPSRKIPVLVLTEDDNGDTVIEPQTALDYLLGLALVVRFKDDTSSWIKEVTGKACYNGAMRFYWPSGAVSKFYWPSDVISVTQFQRDSIENAELQDLNGDFEQIFSAVRTRVIREQRSVREQEAHSQTVARLVQARERISELEREAKETEAKRAQKVDELLERLNAARSAPDTVSDSENDKEKKC